MRADRLITPVCVALLLGAAALSGCKDEAEVPELSAEQIAAFQKRSDEKKRGGAKAASKDGKDGKAAAAAKATPAGGKVAAKAPDKAADKAPKAAVKTAVKATDVTPRDKVERVTPTAPTAAAKAGDDGEEDEDATPAERRRRERQQRIEELKARSEERRKERLARLQAGQPENAPGEGEAAEAEAEAAPLEADTPAALAGPRRPALAAPIGPRGPVLDITHFMSINEVRDLTGNQALAATGPLAGIPASATYNSMYFAPPKRSDFGVSVQVWREVTRRDANDRFRRMRRDFPNAEDTSAVTPKGFFSQWNDLMALVFLDFTKRTIVTVTCSQSLCTPEQLFKLATKAKGHI